MLHGDTPILQSEVYRLTPVSTEDKTTLAKFLEASTVTLAGLQAALPLAQDDGLRKIIEGSIAQTEAQIKGAQEFCQSHGLA